jgi:hypothetical protein
VGLGYASVFTLFATLPFFLACFIPLTLFIPIYVFEDIPPTRAFAKCFRIGFTTWGGTFLLLLVLGIINSIPLGVVAMPWYTVFITKLFFTLSNASGATVSAGYNFMLYLLTFVLMFGMYLFSVFVTVGLAYQYAHACKKSRA